MVSSFDWLTSLTNGMLHPCCSHAVQGCVWTRLPSETVACCGIVKPPCYESSPALLYCHQGIKQIAVSVTQLQSDIARRKKRGLLRAPWKKDELAIHLTRIERAKNSLMLAYSLYSRYAYVSSHVRHILWFFAINSPSGLMLNKMDILAAAQSAQTLDAENNAIASV